jgi:hypothetical protein
MEAVLKEIKLNHVLNPQDAIISKKMSNNVDIYTTGLQENIAKDPINLVSHPSKSYGRPTQSLSRLPTGEGTSLSPWRIEIVKYNIFLCPHCLDAADLTTHTPTPGHSPALPSSSLTLALDSATTGRHSTTYTYSTEYVTHACLPLNLQAISTPSLPI